MTVPFYIRIKDKLLSMEEKAYMVYVEAVIDFSSGPVAHGQ